MMGLILGRPDRLMAGIRQYTANKQDYIGCMTQGTIVRNATRKWFEPQHVRCSLFFGSQVRVGEECLRNCLAPQPPSSQLANVFASCRRALATATTSPMRWGLCISCQAELSTWSPVCQCISSGTS